MAKAYDYGDDPAEVEPPKKTLLPFAVDFLDEDLMDVVATVGTSDRLMLVFLAQIARNTGDK